jgi:hypothetical protein
MDLLKIQDKPGLWDFGMFTLGSLNTAKADILV